MATVTRCPLPSRKVKNVLSSRLPSPEKSTTKTKKNDRDLDPLEKRLIDIRLHLLHKTKRQTQTPSEPTLVFDSFLYLGGLRSLSNKTRLKRLNITHILSVVFIPPPKNLIASHIKHLFLKADDIVSFNMTPYFERACQFIDEARQVNGSVLVHCVCGISRSTTLCCAYLMKHHSMSIEQALVHLRSRRHIIQPNLGFLRQLVSFGDQLQTDRDNTTVNALVEQIENL